MSESMNAKKSYSVTILGSSYRILSDETPAHVAQVGSYVDTLMQGIRDAGVADPARIAVLAALQIASKVVLLERSLEHKIEAYHVAEHMLLKRIDDALSDNLALFDNKLDQNNQNHRDNKNDRVLPAIEE